MRKLSKNTKLNKILSEIYEELEELGIDEVLRYYKAFPGETDYNLYQYGNLKICNEDIKNMYIDAGYKTKFDYTETYKRQVGFVARLFVKEEA